MLGLGRQLQVLCGVRGMVDARLIRRGVCVMFIGIRRRVLHGARGILLAARARLGIQKDRAPLRRRALRRGFGRDLLDLHLEDAKLRRVGVQLGLLAQRTLGQPRPRSRPATRRRWRRFNTIF